MKRAFQLVLIVAACLVFIGVSRAAEQDWPQWRGTNRDGKATGFKAPAAWPKELTQKWKLTVGDGVGTPALVGNKLYVFTRQDNKEILRCLDANTNSELWRDELESPAIAGSDSGYPGPRSSPTIADGKVVIVGVHGPISCYDATSGQKLWRKEGSGAPRFHESSSPIISDGLCIAQFGSDSAGGIVAYDLKSGDEKWKWSGEGPGYASPILLSIDGTKAVVAFTASKLVAVNAADGKELWQMPCRQMPYQSSSPVADGHSVIFAGPNRNILSKTLEKQGDALVAKDRWTNTENMLAYNTPVVRNGWLFGITGGNNLFCLNTETGTTAWSVPISEAAAPTAPSASAAATPPAGAATDAAATAPPQGAGPGRGRGRGMGGRNVNDGTVVDAGAVLIALSPSGRLVVYEPNEKAFKLVASYQVAESAANAYPIVAGNRIYVKDKDSVTLFAIE